MFKNLEGYHMKKIFLFILVSFTAISATFGNTKDLLENDGVDWIEMSESFRIGYVSGLISGLGVAETKLSIFTYLHKGLFKQGGFIWEGLYEKIWEEICLRNITVNQIVDGIDNLYKDFSNRKIKIVDAIFVVNMQIKGKALELINAQVRYLKMQPVSDDLFESITDRLMKFEKKKGFGRGRSYPTYKEIENGEFSKEDLLKIAVFISEDNTIHNLFRYGTYR